MAPINETSHDASMKADNLNRRLSECYQRGMRLSTCDKDFDYAHVMFAECMLQDPGNLQFVEAMVQNLRASAPRARKPLLKLRRGGSRQLSKAMEHRDWKEVFRVGVDLLKSDPWDVKTLQAMAEACAALHHNEVELVYLKQALDAEPKNLEVNRHCARSLARMGQFDQAIACWHRIEKLAGKDEEATRMISSLAQEKLKYPGGRPPAAPRKQVPVEESPQQRELDESTKDVVLRPKQKLEQAIAQDPHNVGNYLELAELLLELMQFNAAESVLTRGISACGEQQPLIAKLNQVRYLRTEEQRKLDEERAIQKKLADAPIRVPWLELVLASAFVLLMLQIVPSLGAAAWKLIDIRNWTWKGWLTLNVIVLLGLVIIRVAPTLRAHWLRRKVQRMYGASRRNA